jgi:hypothetical protein
VAAEGVVKCNLLLFIQIEYLFADPFCCPRIAFQPLLALELAGLTHASTVHSALVPRGITSFVADANIPEVEVLFQALSSNDVHIANRVTFAPIAERFAPFA